VFFSIALVDVPDDLFPPISSKVDINIGHGVTAFAQKALEEQVVAQRVKGGDVQEVGDQGACRS
jgi:hypothetical protein